MHPPREKSQKPELGLYRRLGAAVDEKHVGARIDGYLSSCFPFLTRAGWQKRLRSGELLVNGAPVRPAYRLKLGDLISMFHPPEVEPEVDTGVYVIDECDGVCVVFKPANLPMHENGPYRHHTFAHIVHTSISPCLAAVHRLDRETSGIVVCAEDPDLRQRLSKLFATRTIDKVYLAIVEGKVCEDSWQEFGPIGDLESSAIRIKKWVVSGGQPAETHFQVLSRKANHTLVAARPKTGRTNQIRIHLAVRGHRILGDKLYHPDENVFLNYYEGQNLDWVEAEAGFHRLCLHAAGIGFTHPITHRAIEVCCPMPHDMRFLWNSLPG